MALGNALIRHEASLPAIACIGSIWALCVAASAAPPGRNRTVFRVAGALACFFLGCQLVPGFSNQPVVSDIVISEGAGPMRINLRLDAGSAGLMLLYYYAPRMSSFAELKSIWRPTLVCAVLTVFIVLGAAFAIGYVQVDVKVPSFTALHLVRIALWTCPLEETFFRAVVQGSLARLCDARGWPRWPAVLLASVLFGVAHVAGGPIIVFLASVAGFGYGIAYQLTRRIESAMGVHFLVNALHFLLLTYPFLIH